MKKVLIVSILTLASSLLPIAGGFVTNSYAGTLQQVEDIQNASGEAAGNANSGNYGRSREGAGAGYDGNRYNPAPTVDLRGKEGIVNPNTLKDNNPPPRSLKPSYVPPLP
jgi:hypothetical protein